MTTMAPRGLTITLFLVFVLICLAVSTTQAHVYFTSGDETKSGLLGVDEYGPDERADVEKAGVESEEEKADIPDWKNEQMHAGLNALKNRLQGKYAPFGKRSWLPGTQTGLFGKRGGYWPAVQGEMEKRQLWANQQSGIFGKRGDGRDQTSPRWTVKRSAEESEFGRARRNGGVPHVFRSGGIFGKRSAEEW